MTNETERLLNAEQAVSSLLSNLEKLKKEVGGYSVAKVTLEETRGQVGALVGHLTQLTEKIQSLINVVGKIGTPEILSRIEEVNGLISSLQDSVTKSQNVMKLSVEDENAKTIADLSAMQAGINRRLKKLATMIGVGIPAATIIIVAVILFARKLLGG